jgi:tetratricopeptide (TPR) repeat protein
VHLTVHAPDDAPASDAWHDHPADGPGASLAAAFGQPDAGVRLAACVAALDTARTAPVLLAMASTCMEVSDLAAARRVLDEAAALAPDWSAVHFETGKVCLRTEDMAGAAEAFDRAARLLPAFPSAWANLGAALGELDRTHEALTAFEQALDHDPQSVQAINNVGVLRRELGRLPDAEAAFRQVITLSPDLAMGHYNLGHTLFLQGRYQAALTAYVEGRRRDPDGNAVQASRLAVCRLATGDAQGALRDLQQCTRALPRDYRRQLLADTRAILWALFTHRPDLAGWSTVAGWLDAELAGADRP